MGNDPEVISGPVGNTLGQRKLDMPRAAFWRCVPGGELKLAVAAYDKALALRPGFADAKANRDLVAAKIPKPKKDEEEGEADPNLEPDEIKFDKEGKKGKKGKVEIQHLTDEQIAQMWLRGVQTSPAEFLRLKFAAQDQDAKGPKPGAAGGSR